MLSSLGIHLSKLIVFYLLIPIVISQKQRILSHGDFFNSGGRLICDNCRDKELMVAPGIGFDLTSSYANAAVKFDNGSIVDLGRVEVTPGWADMFDRFSPPYRQYGPPFRTPKEQLDWTLDQASRRLRKLRGLPSTPDIEALSEVLIQLRDLSSFRIHTPVTRIILSIPTLPNLQAADLQEALEIASLIYLKSYRYQRPTLYQGNAAWAGLGRGICKHYLDIEKCDAEEAADFRPRRVLLVSFTGNELIIDSLAIYNAHMVMVYLTERYVEYGYETAREARHWDNSTYWEKMGSKVFNVVARSPGVSELLVLGEWAEEEKFQETMKKALRGTHEGQKLWDEKTTAGIKPEVLAARGAAEMAKRWQGETWGCIEGDWCKNEQDGGDDEL